MSLLLQREIEGGSQARLRFEPDLAVVPFDDFPHKGQADAGSLLRILLVVLPFEEAVNHYVKFHRDAAPIVFHVEDISGVSTAGSFPPWEMPNFDDLFRLVVVLDAIGDEIAEQLCH